MTNNGGTGQGGGGGISGVDINWINNPSGVPLIPPNILIDGVPVSTDGANGSP